MTGWHRHNLDPVHSLAPTSSLYLTDARRTFVESARAFAMDEVLPLATPSIP